MSRMTSSFQKHMTTQPSLAVDRFWPGRHRHDLHRHAASHRLPRSAVSRARRSRQCSRRSETACEKPRPIRRRARSSFQSFSSASVMALRIDFALARCLGGGAYVASSEGCLRLGRRRFYSTAPPLSCRTSPPRGGRLAVIVACANRQRLRNEWERRSRRSPPKWGRCPAGQRGAP